MAPAYPCVQCLFCKQLFASTKSLNSHLDHYLPEYCSANGSQPRRSAQGSHPIPAIRYVRADANRTHEIRWKRDTVRPPDGVLWSFAVPVPSKAVKVANARGGLKSSEWWLEYLKAIPVPPGSDDEEDEEDEDDEDDDDAATSDSGDYDLPPPLPSRKRQAANIGARSFTVAESSRDGAARGALTGHAGQSTRVTFPGATGGGFDANGAGNLTVNIAGKKVSGTDVRAEHREAPPTATLRDKGKSRAAPTPVVDLITPTPSPVARWRIKSPPRRSVHFKSARLSSSPFVVPAAPPVLFMLRISFLSDSYPVEVARGTSLRDAMHKVQLCNPAFDKDMWGMLGLAPVGSAKAWSVRQWEELKSAAMFAEEEVLVEATVVKLM